MNERTKLMAMALQTKLFHIANSDWKLKWWDFICIDNDFWNDDDDDGDV